METLICAFFTLTIIITTVKSGYIGYIPYCYYAYTSEGYVTLKDGDFACAPLEPGESWKDLGKKYVTCVEGVLYTMPCPGVLRWDTKYNICNYPEMATCALSDRGGIVGPTTTTPTTFTYYTRTKKPHSTKPDKPWDTTKKPHPIKTTDKPYSIRTTSKPYHTTKSTDKPYYTTKTTKETTQWYTHKPTPSVVVGGDCLNALTSEGPRRLKHGQMACAPLQEGQTVKGLRFVTCHDSVTSTQPCVAGLRFDTKINGCNWPGQATCALDDDTIIPTGAPTTSSPTTASPSPIPSTGNPNPTPSTGNPNPTPSTGNPNPTPSTGNPNPTPSSETPTPSTKAPTTSQPPTPPPTVPHPSGPCNATTCRLPDCFCYGDVPRQIPLEDMPQFVMLTFDDTVSQQFYDSYFRALLYDNDFKLFNPTGCPIRAALYVSHDNTKYDIVKALWQKGHEIASHTITHSLPQGASNSDYPAMVGEIQGLVDKVLEGTGDQQLVDSIKGFRAPYLRVAGDVMFDVLRDYGFSYDSSILNTEILNGRQPKWPFTLDYVLEECVNPPCPTKPYRGMWEVPLNGWIGDDGQGCSMADACTVGEGQWVATEQQWYDYYQRNFGYFYSVKVPMPIFIHCWHFMNYQGPYPGFTRWIQDLLKNYNDVWLVTPLQVIEWMKNPMSHSQMKAQNWGCV